MRLTAGVICLGLISLYAVPGLAQELTTPDVPTVVPAKSTLQVAAPTPNTNSKRQTQTAAVAKAVSKPEWKELTVAQQQALAPLVNSWVSMDEPRKRKWLAVSQNFSSLPLQEQTLMHSRMKEWAALSPQDRVQARLNFAGARELPTDKRLEKWEAYQSLPAEQRQHLAATAPTKATGAAIAVKPSPQKTLATTPTLPASSAPKLVEGVVSAPVNTHVPKIAASSQQVDRRTLLPVHAPSASEQSKQP